MEPHSLSIRDVAALRDAPLTSAAVGATEVGTVPEGHHAIHRARVLGTGEARFEQAAERLLGWRMHRRAGLRVEASSPRVVSGAVAVLRWGPGCLAVRAPVRVVRVVDEPHRKGFAYGTLPGHPESGEEAFVVELRPDGAVVLTVTAFSRPATALARLAGPAGRAAQGWITRRYLHSL